MKVKLDANLGRRGKTLLVNAGHDVSTAREQSLGTAPDATLIAVCADEARTLITLDTDFANPLVYPPSNYAGIVVLRMRSRATADDIEHTLRAVLAALKGSALTGRLIVADQGGRVREYLAEPNPST